MKKLILTLSVFILLVQGSLLVGSQVFAQSITLRDTLFLSKATHLNYDLASWDSVFVKIVRGLALVTRIKLTEGDSGEYAGVYKPTYTGDFVAQYYAVYSGEIIREEQYFSVLDTTAFMGTAGSDTSNIKLWFQHNYDIDADGEIDTVEYVKAGNITASCEGTGANTLTIRIRNSSDSTALSGFNIVIEDSATGGWYRSGSTNSSGNCVFGVEDGSYVVYMWAPRWIITSPRYFNVTANMDSTFYATLITPNPPPPGDSVCVVYGYVRHLDNTPYANARVKIWMDKTSVTYHGVLVDVRSPAIAYTDVNGYYEFSTTKSNVDGILPNDLLWYKGLNNTEWWIEAVTNTMDKIGERWIKVPVSSSWEVIIEGN